MAGGWLATFGDARLDVLVTEAMAHNPDLLVAAARVAGRGASTWSSRSPSCVRRSTCSLAAAER